MKRFQLMKIVMNFIRKLVKSNNYMLMFCSLIITIIKINKNS